MLLKQLLIEWRDVYMTIDRYKKPKIIVPRKYDTGMKEFIDGGEKTY